MDGTLYYGSGKDGEVDFVTGAPAWSGCFKFYITAGIAAATVPVATSVPVLYNPAVPTVVGGLWAPLVELRIMRVSIGVVSGALVAGCFQYGIASGVTFSSTATTNSGSLNTFVGKGAATPAGWYTTATCTSAPTVFDANGMSAAGDKAAGVLFNLTDMVNGAIVLPPGSAFWPLLGNAAGKPNLTALVTVDVIQTPYVAGF